MYAIAIDKTDWETQMRHPKSLRQAYRDIEMTLGRYGFVAVQQSTYHCDNDDLANWFDAVATLRGLSWFAESVKDICGYRGESWSDFTPMKGSNR